jgi:hypothetical protein
MTTKHKFIDLAPVYLREARLKGELVFAPLTQYARGRNGALPGAPRLVHLGYNSEYSLIHDRSLTGHYKPLSHAVHQTSTLQAAKEYLSLVPPLSPPARSQFKAHTYLLSAPPHRPEPCSLSEADIHAMAVNLARAKGAIVLPVVNEAPPDQRVLAGKRLGMHKGAPDLLIWTAKMDFFMLELKTTRGQLSPAQEDFRSKALDRKHNCFVTYGWKQTRMLLEGLL